MTLTFFASCKILRGCHSRRQKQLWNKKLKKKNTNLFVQDLKFCTTLPLEAVQKSADGSLVYLIAWVVIQHGLMRCFTSYLYICRWSIIQTGRYNVGDIPGIPFPSLPFLLEETLPGEFVDDTEETLLRYRTIKVDKIPEADFSSEVKTIELISNWSKFRSEIPMVLCLSSFPKERLGDIGILALDFFTQIPTNLNRKDTIESCMCIPSFHIFIS